MPIFLYREMQVPKLQNPILPSTDFADSRLSQDRLLLVGLRGTRKRTKNMIPARIRAFFLLFDAGIELLLYAKTTQKARRGTSQE
ncbi:hypothetical protein Ngar_c07030 [Candidatus Nitrososphaera gargensis Ga9.2]|uniref:Uncharacterized protein n=1 Tax=Nitrososphaera gargensis (strain Ga9.2) TaxID=1237085 RepID=K0I8P3_NITGG|nr:hypothetical protein Ngar_c07030 [Candidatus Nitrososphaera gargensis Ga9.2]